MKALKWIGLFVGYVLALGPLLGMIVSVFSMIQTFGGIAAQEGMATPGAATAGVRAALKWTAIGGAVAPIGAVLIVVCFSSLLREAARLPEDQQREGRTLAIRRTVAAFIDWVIIPAMIAGACYAAGVKEWWKWIALTYVLFKDTLAGKSLGKLCTGIRVVAASGSVFMRSQSFGRNFPIMLPIVPWVAGGEIWGYRDTRIGEGWVGTRVERVGQGADRTDTSPPQRASSLSEGTWPFTFWAGVLTSPRPAVS